MNPFEFDHVGIAVESLESGAGFYQALGLTSSGQELVESENVRVEMFELGNNCRIELLESTKSDGAVGKFLASRGPGIHHICFRVKDIESVAKKLKNSGVKLINETPRAGAHNCKVVFVHPKSAGGVLIELSEKVKS